MNESARSIAYAMAVGMLCAEVADVWWQGLLLCVVIVTVVNAVGLICARDKGAA